MAAGSVIFACKGASHGGALAGVTHARLVPSTSYKIDPGGADSPGDADCLVTDRELAVEVYGNQWAVLLARIGVVAADLVIDTFGAAGASETLTASDVYFDEGVAGVDIPAKDSGGKIVAFGIRGHVHFAVADQFADVLVAG